MSDRGNTLLRLADRYIGIPIVAVLGLFKKSVQKPESFNTVAFLATAAIGDTLLISPVIKDFIATHPEADITVFCGKTNKGTFEMVLPNIKLIAVLRNPIDRAYCQFKYTVMKKGYKKTFREFLKDHRDALERGLYHM